MSYCRFSSDNFQCDLYCYESDLGFVTHTSAGRYVGIVPSIPGLGTVGNDEFLAAYNAQMAFLKDCPTEKITLPHPGETFNDGDLESFRDRLLYLRRVGYRFPDGVLDAVDEELASPTEPS